MNELTRRFANSSIHEAAIDFRFRCDSHPLLNRSMGLHRHKILPAATITRARFAVSPFHPAARLRVKLVAFEIYTANRRTSNIIVTRRKQARCRKQNIENWPRLREFVRCSSTPVNVQGRKCRNEGWIYMLADGSPLTVSRREIFVSHFLSHESCQSVRLSGGDNDNPLSTAE